MKYFDMNVEMPYLIVICVSCVGHGRRRRNFKLRN